VTLFLRALRWRMQARPTQNKRPRGGRPVARGTRATADGDGVSEGGVVAMTSGNNRKEGPDRAQSTRVGTNFIEGTVTNALTLVYTSPQLVKVAEHREPYLRRSRMVEISKSGSGEGSAG